MISKIEIFSFDRVDTGLSLIIKLKSLIIKLKAVIIYRTIRFAVDHLLEGVVYKVVFALQKDILVVIRVYMSAFMCVRERV